MKKEFCEKLTCWIQRLGLLILLAFGYCYSFWGAGFAETCLNLPGLDFPIFVGEIALGLCLILLAFLLVLKKEPFHSWHFLAALGAAWVIGRAVWGYAHFGPLSLRNAALFYYSFFAVTGYYFFDKNFIRNVGGPWLIIVFLLMMAFYPIDLYHVLPCLIFLFVLGQGIKSHWVRNFLSVVILIYLVATKSLFSGSRSHIFGVGIFVLYGVVVFFVYLYRQKASWRKYFLLVLPMMAFFVGIIFCFDRNALQSLTTPLTVFKEFQQYDLQIQKAEPGFVFQKLTPHLYHKNFENNPIPTVVAPASHEDGLRPLDVAYNNINFRIFIWRDMMQEVIAGREIWGVDFGKPLRSRSLEILHWAETEWGRDGWITPHNSYLHMIYRGGIIGIGFILILGFAIVKLTRDFLRQKSVTGLLLVGALVYWCAIANFLVFLEFPYSAMPFWALLGMLFAYRQNFEAVAQIQSDDLTKQS